LICDIHVIDLPTYVTYVRTASTLPWETSAYDDNFQSYQPKFYSCTV